MSSSSTASPVSVVHVEKLDIDWLREEWAKLKIAKKRLALQQEKLVLDQEIIRAEKKSLRTQQVLLIHGSKRLSATSSSSNCKKEQDSTNNKELNQKENDWDVFQQKAGEDVQEQPEEQLLMLKASASSNPGGSNTPIQLSYDKQQNNSKEVEKSNLEERVRCLEKENQCLRNKNNELKVVNEALLVEHQQAHDEKTRCQIEQLQLERDEAIQDKQNTQQTLNEKIAELADVTDSKGKLGSALKQRQGELNESKILVELYKRFHEDSRKKKEETQSNLESLQQIYDEQQELLKETREALLEEKVNRMDEMQQQQRENDEVQIINQSLQETIKEKQELEEQVRDQQLELDRLKLLAQKSYEQINDDLKSLQKRREKQLELLAEVQGTNSETLTSSAPVVENEETAKKEPTDDEANKLRRMEMFENYIQNVQEEFDVDDEDEEYIEEEVTVLSDISDDEYLVTTNTKILHEW